MSIIIVDIDGTVCNSSDRLSEVGFDPKAPREEWPEYWGDHSKDKPIEPVIEFVNQLYDVGYYIWMVTIRGRVNSYKDTKSWLARYGVDYTRLYTLGEDSNKFSDPSQVKREFIQQLDYEIRDDIFMAIEDSPSMIKMFKEEGIRVLDVGQFHGSM